MPNLSLDALRKRIHDRALGPLHLFVGDDTVLMDRLVDAVEGTVDEADRPFAVDRVYAGEDGGSPVDIVASARSLPMLGDRRVVIVLRAERLLKPKRARSAAADAEDEDAGGEDSGEPADLAPLEDYIAGPAEHTALVFVASAVDRTRRLVKQLLKVAQVTSFDGIAADKPADRLQMHAAAAELVEEELRQAGRQVEPAAARLLVERAGGDISRLRGDLERVVLFTEGRSRISVDDVAEIVSTDLPVDDDWAMVNAIAAGEAGRALAEAGKRIERGDSPHMLLGQLRWWVSARLVEGDAARVKPAVEALLRTDLALKSSGGDHRVLIERLVVELTGRPLPRQRGGWRS